MIHKRSKKRHLFFISSKARLFYHVGNTVGGKGYFCKCKIKFLYYSAKDILLVRKEPDWNSQQNEWKSRNLKADGTHCTLLGVLVSAKFLHLPIFKMGMLIMTSVSCCNGSHDEMWTRTGLRGLAHSAGPHGPPTVSAPKGHHPHWEAEGCCQGGWE